MARASQSTVVTGLFVLLAVGALGLVAATIDAPAAVGATGADGGSGEVRQSGGEGFDVSVSGEASGDASAQEQISLAFCVPVLRSPPVVGGLLLSLAGLAYATYYRTDAATAGLVTAGVVPVVMLGYFLLTNCHTGGSGDGSLLSGADVLGETGGLSAPAVPPALVGLVFVGAVLVGGALLLFTGGEAEDVGELTDDEDGPDESAFAEAAGRAADRIERTNADVDNAVYRAWVEMTDPLDVDDPKTTPPREFAEAAVDAGLDREDVAELTQLFTDVRYGGKRPDDREERALAALRNIEETYRDGAAEPGGDDR